MTTSRRASLRSSNPNHQKHVSYAEATPRKKKVIIDPEQEAGILEK